ncbi:MAG: BatD family protein [Mangrovibacterium sp.]
MNKKINSSIIVCLTIALLVLFSNESNAQSCFAQVSIYPRTGVVRQPFKITIAVHTSTWFTAPLQFKNFQVDKAFIMPYTQTTPSTSYINKKKYATLTFYYLVYPFEEGEITIPSLQIIATTPNDGDYKGIPKEIQTKEQKIQALKVPNANGEEVWNVATNMTISEKWDKDLDKIKVGDVLNRSLLQYAAGTLPNFIKPISLAQINNVSSYPSEPQFKERRTQFSINGELSQQVAYLFEKEGTVNIPEQKIYWYNPETKKTHQRILPAQEIHVNENPNLEMINSLKDSLDALNAQSNQPIESKRTWPWKQITMLIIAATSILYYIAKFFRVFYRKIQTKRKNYLKSTLRKRRNLNHALRTRNRKESIKALYTWFDALRAEKNIQEADIFPLLSNQEQHHLAEMMHQTSSKISSKEANLITQIVKKISIDKMKEQEMQNRLNL